MALSPMMKHYLAIKEKYKLDERVLRNMIVADERPETVPAGPVSLKME